MSHPCFLQYCYHHVPSFVSPKFSPQAVLTVPCPVHAASKDLLMSLVYSLWAFCWAQMTTWYEELQAQSLVNQLLSERNLIWVPPAAPSFLLPSSHLSDLHISEISAQPSLFDTHSASRLNGLTFMNLPSFHRKRFCLDTKHLSMIRQISATSEKHCKKGYEQRETEIICRTPQRCK